MNHKSSFISFYDHDMRMERAIFGDKNEMFCAHDSARPNVCAAWFATGPYSEHIAQINQHDTCVNSKFIEIKEEICEIKFN